MRRRPASSGLLQRVPYPGGYRPNRVRFNGLNDGLERTGSVPDFSSVTCAFGFNPQPFRGAPGERARIYQAVDQNSPVLGPGGYTEPFRVFYDPYTLRLRASVWNETAAAYDVQGVSSSTNLTGDHFAVVEYSTSTGLKFWVDGVLDGTFAATYPGPILGSLADEANIGTGQVGIVPRANHYSGDLYDLWVGYNQTPGISAFWPRRNLGDGDVGYGRPEVFFAGHAVDWNAGTHRGTQTGWALTSEATGMEDSRQ